MHDHEIASIETALGCILPKGYRKFLLNHSAEVAKFEELLPLRVVLWTDPAVIVDENKYARANPADKPIGHQKTPWPDNYFVVGTNGAADYWFIDLNRELQGIWSYQHEAEDVELHYENFGEWMGNLRRDARNPEEWGGTRPT